MDIDPATVSAGLASGDAGQGGPAGDDGLAGKMAALREALRGGAELTLPDGSNVPFSVPVLVTVAQMIHTYEMQQHRPGDGPAPTLLEVLLETPVQGQHLQDNQWLALITEHPGLDEDTRDQVVKLLLEEDAALTEGRIMPQDVPAAITFTPRDVAKYRTETLQWLESDRGTRYYQDAMDVGRQSVFVDRPGVPPARALAMTEAQALADADMYFIDEDMCQLLTSSHESMPSFAPVADDLPSPTGFAVFAAPISHHRNRAWFDADLLAMDSDGGLVDLQETLRDNGTQIVAVSWRPHVYAPGSPHWRAGGAWFTFYAVPQSKALGEGGGEFAALFAQAGQWLPTLAPENEALIAWYPGEGDDSAHQLHPRMGTSAWARIVLTAFQLAQQKNLAQTDVETIPGRKVNKAKARRTGVRQTRAQEVRVVRLRARLRAAREQAAAQEGLPSRVYRHRWVVRGFWRQTWYATRGLHRPQWIAPHLRGPDGAPLLGGQKVTVVGVPRGGVAAPAGPGGAAQ